jgi:hypothetical protein
MANMQIQFILAEKNQADAEKKQADAEKKQADIKLSLWAQVKLVPAEQQMAKAIELGLITVAPAPVPVPVPATIGGGSLLLSAPAAAPKQEQLIPSPMAGGGSSLMAGGGSSLMAGGGGSFAAAASAAHATQMMEITDILAKVETISTFVLADDQIGKVVAYIRNNLQSPHLDKFRLHLSTVIEKKGYDKRYSELITMLKKCPHDKHTHKMEVRNKFLAIVDKAEKEAAKAAEAAVAAAAKPSKQHKKFVVADHCLLKNVGDKQVYVNGKQPIWGHNPSECRYLERTGYECSIMGCCWLAPDGNRLYLTHGGEKRPGREPTKRCRWAGEDGMQCLNGNCRKGAHFGRSKRETSLWLKFPPATSPVSGGGGDSYYEEEENDYYEESDYVG